MAFNIFSTLNQNLQDFGGDAYDAYQAGKSKVGNVASTINTNLQDFGGDLYDAGNQIKNNVSNFGTQTYNQGKNVASTIKKNVGDYATQQINEIKAIPSQIGEGIDIVKQGVRDANYNMWNSGLKSFTGKNNSTLTEAFPNAYNELSKNTGKADEDKVMKFVEEIAKAGYDQDQAMEILQTTLAEQPDYFNKKTPFDRVRQTAANRGREFGKTYEDFSTGKIGFGEATLRNAGDIIATPFGVMGDAAMSIPGVETAVGKVGEVVTSIPGVKPGMEAYGEFAKNNPRFAQNIEAFTNLGLSALGTTQGQALMKQGTKAVGRKVAQGADYIDNVTSPLTTPISNAVSKGGEKIKSILAPINPDEQILKDAGLKTVKGMVGDQVVEIPEYGIMDKARSFVAPAETKRLVNRALSPRGTGLGDKQKLASVVNAEKNVRNYHQLVRSGKLKGDLSSLESTAQSVVDNLDEVGSKIGKSVDKVQANVAISDDAYKAIDEAVGARGASRTPTAKILENFKEDTAGGMTLKEAFDIKKIYQTEIGKLILSRDAGTLQYSALVKGVDELTNQIDNAIETQLKGSKFKELKSQYRLMKSMVGDITNSAMVEGRRSPQTFVEQLGTIEAMGNIISSPLATGKQFLAKEIGEMNSRGGSWKELVKRLDDEAVSAYKKSQTTAGKAMKREMENLPVATKPPIVPKAKPKATTESAFKNNKGFINPSEIKKSLIPKKGADEARQFYDDLVYAGNSPIVAQRETAKRFGTIRAMSASKAGTFGGEGAKEAPKTGWFKGADGKMKFEIDDSKANFEFPKRTSNESRIQNAKANFETAKLDDVQIKDAMEIDGFKGTPKEYRDELIKHGYEDMYNIKSGNYRLGDILQHSDLYKQYPWLENTPVSFHTEGGMRSAGEMTNGKISIALNAKDPKSVILHEIQHIIQEKEGFARGGNPESFKQGIEYYKKLADYNRDILGDIRYDKMLEKDKTSIAYKKLVKEEEEALRTYKIANEKYKELSSISPMESYNNQAGEVEARNVQTRMNMTAKERALKSPESTEDVPRLKQIVRLKNDGTSMSIDKAGTMDISKAPDALIQEAKKYKSADEFIKAQGEPVYHGTKYKFDTFSKEKIGSSVGSDKEGIFFTNSKILASRYADSIDENGILKRGITMEAYPAMNNPLTIESKGTPLSYFTSNKENILKKAKKGGFDGVVVRDKVGDENIIIAFNPEQIKTQSQLKQIYEQANKTKVVPQVVESKGTMDMSKAPESLIQEAKKYKSADEFIKSKGKPVYHGTNSDFSEFSLRYSGQTDPGFLGTGIYLTPSKSIAKVYGKKIMNVYPDIKNPLVIDDVYMFGGVNPDKIRSILGISKNSKPSEVRAKLIEKGYDGVYVNEILGGGKKKLVEVVALNPSKVKTEAQLKQIYDQANKK